MAIPPPAPDKAPERRPLLLLLVVLIAFLLIIGGAVVYILSLRPPAGPAPFVEFGPPVFGSPGDATVNVSTASREVGLGSFHVTLRDLGTSTAIFDVELHVGTLHSNAGAVVSFEDQTSSSRLSAGDVFRLINMPTGVTYSLILVYSPESRTVASVTIPL